jgi:hypothetical protein
MNAKRLIPVAVAGLALAGAASADAATYCAHQATACPAGSLDQGNDLQQAFNAAHLNAGPDTVVIGPGTYTAPVGGFGAYQDDGLQIVGAGASTILTGTATPVVTLHGANLSHVAVQLPSGNNATGISADAPSVIDDVEVTGASGHFQEAVDARGAVTVRNSTLTLPDVSGYGVWATVNPYGAPTIEDSTIDAYTTLYANDPSDIGTPSTVQRTTSYHGKLDVMANGAKVDVRNAVFHHVSGGSSALAVEDSFGHAASLSADHVTILGDGSGTAVQTSASAGMTTSITVTNSSIHGFSRLTYRDAAATGLADIAFAYSDVHPGSSGDTGPGAVTFGPGMVDLADPGFVSNADPRPAAGSGLIDAGDPAAPTSATDHDGLPRASGARQDIGAYEVQQAVAPTVPAGDGDAVATDPAPAGGEEPVPAVAVPTTTASATGHPVDIRALLRQAIATAKGHRYTFVWPQGGTVRFAWVRHGHTIASGRMTRKAPGRATLTVKGAKRLPHGARVRASFTPTGGAPVRVSVKR